MIDNTQPNGTPVPNVISAICEAMLSDDTNQSGKLINLYTDSDPEAKDLIDRVLIIVCGYSLPTLIEGAEKLES